MTKTLEIDGSWGEGTSKYRVAQISKHLITNAWAIKQFGLARITIDEKDRIITIR
jgi:RNA 3'-terminal phosphate cyclase (ATP)